MSKTFDELVAVMERLRAPGGCPWDNEQTYGSLARYLLEEAYETFDAIQEAGVSVLGSCHEGICGTCEQIVLEVTDVVETPFTPNDPKQAEIDKQLAEALLNDVLQQYLSQLQNELGATINQTALQRVIGSS